MWDAMPPLSALRAFEAAARLGSLSAAGRELNVTHAAVAQQVKRLEQWLSVPLLAREGRGVVPTAEGATLATGLSEGFGAIHAAVDRLNARHNARPLRITSTPSFATDWLIPNLAAFRAAHPDFEVVIDPDTRLIDLTTGDYDIAFRYGHGVWPGLETTRLVASDMVIAAAASLIGEHKITTPRDLFGWPWLQEYCSDEWRLWFRTNGIEDAHNPNTTHLPANLVIDGIRRGLGIGMVARAWLTTDIVEGRVRVLFEAEEDCTLGYYLAVRPPPHRPAVKAFVAWVRRTAAQAAASPVSASASAAGSG